MNHDIHEREELFSSKKVIKLYCDTMPCHFYIRIVYEENFYFTGTKKRDIMLIICLS